MRKAVVAMSVFILCAAIAAPAEARRGVYSGTSGYEALGKGLVDISFDNTLLFRYLSLPGEGDNAVSTTFQRISFLGGITPKFFVITNLSVGLSINYFYEANKTTVEQGGTESTTESDDSGFMGFAMANYHIRLGNSLFFKPGAGAGYFMGKRTMPTSTEGLKLENDLSGLAGRVDLGFVYYASANFNLRAGLDVIIKMGTETDKDDNEQDFTAIDAGVSAGLGYSF